MAETAPPPATVVLSAGAPNSPLMAGALCAVYDQGKRFNHVYTSGAGALIGLLYIAPRGKTPGQALRDVRLIGVSDAIARFFPLGYKAFFKPGPWTRPFHRWGQIFKLGGRLDRPQDAYKRLYNDWIDLWVSAMTPTTLTYRSKAVCAPFPLLDDWIDFSKLSVFDGEFYMNAYNISKNRMDQFVYKPALTRYILPIPGPKGNPAQFFYAALAYPFLYPPVALNGDLYIEGADRDPLNLAPLASPEYCGRRGQAQRTVVLLDVLGCLEDALVREPLNVWDAWGISIMAPVVSLAQKNLQAFQLACGMEGERQEHTVRTRDGIELRFVKVGFDIPKAHLTRVLDWSYSNFTTLWDIGYQAGLNLCMSHGHCLPNRVSDA